MRTAFLDPGDAAWTKAMGEVRHDFYHLPRYVAFAARRQEVGEPLAFLAEERARRFFVPLILRPVPTELNVPGMKDATCPRGYPGPLVSGGRGFLEDGFLRSAIESLVDGLASRGVVSAFVRLHPLLLPPLEPLRRIGELVDHGDSVSIDLSLSDEERRRQTRENHRRDIRKAMERGYEVRIDVTWGRFEDFVAAYAQSMRRLGAVEAWSFSRDYFLELRRILADALHLCVVEIDGQFAAGALLTEEDGIVEYHLAGTDDRHLAASPSKLIVAFAAGWARERGNRVLHLAGSLRRGDPLSRFKLGFSPLIHPVYSWRLVTDQVAYDTLVQARARIGGGDPAAGAYFPAYRASQL